MTSCVDTVAYYKGLIGVVPQGNILKKNRLYNEFILNGYWSVGHVHIQLKCDGVVHTHDAVLIRGSAKDAEEGYMGIYDSYLGQREPDYHYIESDQFVRLWQAMFYGSTEAYNTLFKTGFTMPISNVDVWLEQLE